MAVVPAGTIEDHHGMGIRGDLAADLAEMMVHRGGIADRHDQRRRLALRRADRTKQIGRGEAEIFWRHRPAAGLPPYPGQAVLLANASLVLKPYLDSRTGRRRFGLTAEPWRDNTWQAPAQNVSDELPRSA